MSHDPTFSKALEFQIFKNPMWSFFYIFSVAIFMIHACLGWKKVTPVLGIPRGHIQRVEILGFLDRDRDRIGIQGWPGTRLGQLILDWNDFFLNWIELDKDWFLFLSFFLGRSKVDGHQEPILALADGHGRWFHSHGIHSRGKRYRWQGSPMDQRLGEIHHFSVWQWWLSLSHDLSLAQKSFAAYRPMIHWSMHFFDHVWPLNSLQSHVFSSHAHTCSAWVVPGGYTIEDVQNIFYSLRPGGIF